MTKLNFKSRCKLCANSRHDKQQLTYMLMQVWDSIRSVSYRRASTIKPRKFFEDTYFKHARHIIQQLLYRPTSQRWGSSTTV